MMRRSASRAGLHGTAPYRGTATDADGGAGNRNLNRNHGASRRQHSSSAGSSYTHTHDRSNSRGPLAAAAAATTANTAAAAATGPAPDTDPPARPLAVVAESAALAYACYDELTNQIWLEEGPAYGGADTERTVRGFVGLVRPTLLLVGGTVAAHSGLMRLLTRGVADGSGDGAEEGEGPAIPYRLLKSAAFDVRNGRTIILSKLRVLSLMRQGDRRQCSSGDGGGSAAAAAYHSLSSLLDLHASPAPLVRALGGLLHHLQSTTHRLEEGGTVTVATVRHAHSSRYMRIDAATLRSLHVFATDHHPLLAAKGGGGGRRGRRGRRGGGGSGSTKDKEGFSLYTLLDRTRSKMGRGRLREMMAQPLLDAAALGRRYDGVDLFLRTDCRGAVGTLLVLLGRVGAIDRILLRMQRVQAVPGDFLALSQALGCAVGICATLAGDVREVLRGAHRREMEERIQEQQQGQQQGQQGLQQGQQQGHADGTGGTTEAMRQLAFLEDILRRCHVPTLRKLHERITAIVDHELTAEKKDSVEVHYGFHEELDSAREAFDALDETLSAVGAEVLNKHPELQRLTVVFLPQVGFLIQLDRRNHAHNVANNTFPDLPADFSFVFMQAQDDAVYFKNTDMRQLDEEVGDLDAYIKDTQLMIVHELEDDILDCEVELRSTFGAIADLDCILSFAACASDLNFVRPEIVAPEPGSDECSIYVENGRHPLQELVIDDEFIANDVMIDSANRVNVVTGPNFSGKSCYARQVGVLVYMAHIGCFIPCDRAKITITDQILARISSVETCAVPQSSFQQDLTQMATILRRSTPRTLVLIDEFGKGTAPSSGIAVLTSALRKLSSIKCKVVCTTHFLEVFSLGLLKDGQDGIKTLHMAVHIPSSDQDNPIPLFKLEEGVANSSAGLVCARMAGVKRSVVSRANQILGALKDGKPVRPIEDMTNTNSVLQPESKAALRMFLGCANWASATHEEIGTLQEMIVRM